MEPPNKMDTKRRQSLAINAAFKQVIGAVLEPIGYVKIKSRYPYYVRVVDGEIIQVITIKHEEALDNGYKAFNIYGGVASVYRMQIDLKSPPLSNKAWMFSCFCPKEHRHHDFECDFSYPEHDDNALLHMMEIACLVMKQNILPTLNAVCTLEKVVSYYSKSYGFLLTLTEPLDFQNANTQDVDNEGLLLIKTKCFDDGSKQLKETFSNLRTKIRDGVSDMSIDKYERLYQSAEKRRIEQFEIRMRILNNDDLYCTVLNELERRKKANQRYLQELGLTI